MNKMNWVMVGFLIAGLTACVQDGSGKNGVNGDAGPQGEPGRDGINGTNGTDGADGAKGDTGAPGADGVNGTNGTDGTDGKDGARGPSGADGTNGTNGVDGAPGANGADGTNGTNGVDGAPGANGTDGKDGTDGTTIVVVCGDGQCQAPAETLENCAADCTPPGSCAGNCGGSAGTCYCDDACTTFGDCCDDYVAECGAPSPFCGDGVCNGTETFNTCPADCEAPVPFCGDSSCNNGETPKSCEADCGKCGNGTCDAGEDHLLCPDDCAAPVVDTTLAGPFKLYREHLTDGSYLCSIGVNPNYASGAADNQIVGEGAPSFLENWETGSPSQILSYQGHGIESDGYVKFELPRDATPVGSYTMRFSYRGYNAQSSKYEYAQYGDADTQLAHMTDADLAMIYCFQYDPTKSSSGCSGKALYEVFVNPNTNKKDCYLTAKGNAQIAND